MFTSFHNGVSGHPSRGITHLDMVGFFSPSKLSGCRFCGKKVLLTPENAVREQIPRLSCFISLLIYHVWTSKTLCQTLDVGNRNQYMITFVKNILEITRIPLPVVTLAVKYIQRLRKLRAASACIPGDETRIFSVALMLAQKYSDDMPYGNRMWGKVLGLSAIELTRLEINFLSALGYNLYVPEVEYSTFCRGVQALAREWNASLASLEERPLTSPAIDKQAANAPMRINTASHMLHNGKPALLTPSSPVLNKKLVTNVTAVPESEIAHVTLGVSPSSTIDSCCTPDSAEDENDASSSSNNTSADFCHKMAPSSTPSPSCESETPTAFRSAAPPPTTYLQPFNTPCPPTLDDFIIAAPKMYGLVANSITSMDPSPSLLQSARPLHHLFLSPIPGVNNMLLAKTMHAPPPHLFLAAGGPRYLLVNAGEFSKPSSCGTSRAHSRAGSEVPGDEGKVVKRTKLA
ncbi:hypothetical protein BC830DRAFT_1135971 [Chytriomyces sp. MP71]|nr:hypothetical protein BC830DRAFT_1135971 [Chytriomyces sp. MP71]